jgi:hypothetical protein
MFVILLRASVAVKSDMNIVRLCMELLFTDACFTEETACDL